MSFPTIEQERVLPCGLSIGITRRFVNRPSVIVQDMRANTRIMTKHEALALADELLADVDCEEEDENIACALRFAAAALDRLGELPNRS